MTAVSESGPDRADHLLPLFGNCHGRHHLANTTLTYIYSRDRLSKSPAYVLSY